MTNKKCRICNNVKDIIEFHKKKCSSDGVRNECKDCVKEIQKKYRDNRTDELKEKHNKYLKEWRLNNKGYESRTERKEYRKIWRENNKEKIYRQTTEYVKNNRQRLNELDKPNRKIRYKKISNDPLLKMRESVRNTIRRTIKNQGFKKNVRTEKILGCSYLDFKKHLESKFESWMNYENYGKYNGELNYGWDIDHIIPTSSASTEEEIIRLNHYTNLRPLCSKINRDVKRDKII